MSTPEVFISTKVLCIQAYTRLELQGDDEKQLCLYKISLAAKLSASPRPTQQNLRHWAKVRTGAGTYCRAL